MAYAIWGALCGLAGFLALLVATVVAQDLSSGGLITVSLATLTSHAGLALLVESMLTFVTGGLVADWLQARRSAGRNVRDISDRLAVRLMGNQPRAANTDQSIKRLADFIGAIAPILVLTASVVASYFTYRAAVAKLGEQQNSAAENRARSSTDKIDKGSAQFEATEHKKQPD